MKKTKRKNVGYINHVNTLIEIGQQWNAFIVNQKLAEKKCFRYQLHKNSHEPKGVSKGGKDTEKGKANKQK